MNAYPIFRLALFLAAGIFCAETFRIDMGLLPVAVLLLLLLVLGRLLKETSYGGRWIFGAGVAIFMFGVGWVLTSHAWKTVAVDWYPERREYCGILQESPQEKKRTYQCLVSVGGKDVLAYFPKDSLSASLKVADEVCFFTRIQPSHIAGDKLDFDYATYLYHRGISGTAYVPASGWQKTGRVHSLTLKQKALLLRERMLNNYRKWGVGDGEMPVLAALTLGYKGDLDKDTRNDYSVAGIAHVLALSGMHIGILWWMLNGVLGLVLRGPFRWLRSIVIILVLWAFAYVVGLESSVVRAVVMCMLLEMGRLAGSRLLSMNTLAIAAFFMLLYRPFYLFDVSFQLSFVAVASILIFYPLFFKCVDFKNRVARWIWGIASVSAAAQLGTAPLVMYYFSSFSVYFLLTNLVASLLVPLIIYVCICMVLLAPLPVVQVWVVALLNALVSALNVLAGWTSTLPGATFSLSVWKPVELMAFYFVLGVAVMYWRTRKRRWLIRGLAACVLLLALHLYALLVG